MKSWIYLLVIVLISFSCSSGGDEPDIPGRSNVTVEIVPSDNAPVLWQNIGFYIKSNSGSFKKVDWKFGDGTSGSGATISHSYKTEGKYNISVEATTNEGVVLEQSISLTVAGKSLSKALNYFDRNRVWICAHRCNMGDVSIPENSITALKRCIESESVDLVEIDPRMTNDGVIVLMHDETVDRTTNGTGKVSDLTYAQIRTLRLKLSNGTLTGDTIPTLKDFLLEAKGRIFIDLDFINKVPHSELYNLVKECGMLDQVMFYTSGDTPAINSLLGYLPAGIVFSYIGKESEAIAHSKQGIYVTQISTARMLDSNLGSIAAQNSLVVLSNTLVQNGITIDSDIKNNNDYSGMDKLLRKGINIIQTDQAPLIHNYLKNKNKR